jgi:DNA-binding transcriptional MerR regulator
MVKWRAARVGLYPHPSGKRVPNENKSQLSPRALRRSFAVLMRSEGTPLEEIAEVLNHGPEHDSEPLRVHGYAAEAEDDQRVQRLKRRERTMVPSFAC